MAAHISIRSCPCDEPSVPKASPFSIALGHQGAEEDVAKMFGFVHGESTINVHGVRMKFEQGNTWYFDDRPNDVAEVQVWHPIDHSYWHKDQASKRCERCCKAGRDLGLRRQGDRLILEAAEVANASTESLRLSYWNQRLLMDQERNDAQERERVSREEIISLMAQIDKRTSDFAQQRHVMKELRETICQQQIIIRQLENLNLLQQQDGEDLVFEVSQIKGSSPALANSCPASPSSNSAPDSAVASSSSSSSGTSA